MNIRISSRTLVLAVGLILLVATVLWLLIYNSFDPVTQAESRTAMLMEASRFLSQIVLATIVGGMVPLLFNWYAKQQEERRQAWEKEQEQQKLKIDEDNALRRKLLGSLISIRAQVEKTRREFGLLPAGERKAGYRKAVEALLDARRQSRSAPDRGPALFWTLRGRPGRPGL
jgi:Mg2+/citrate symporter